MEGGDSSPTFRNPRRRRPLEVMPSRFLLANQEEAWHPPNSGPCSSHEGFGDKRNVGWCPKSRSLLWGRPHGSCARAKKKLGTEALLGLFFNSPPDAGFVVRNSGGLTAIYGSTPNSVVCRIKRNHSLENSLRLGLGTAECPPPPIYSLFLDHFSLALSPTLLRICYRKCRLWLYAAPAADSEDSWSRIG